jgi:dolichol-phosphate mannosyltransferase
MVRALAVIPTYNEAETLEQVLAELLGADADLEALVVDDGSPDGTGDIADRIADTDSRVSVLHRTEKSGLGSAYRAGFRWGLERGFDVLCEMDADLSHNPWDLPRLIAGLEDADLAIGSRYIPGGKVVNWPARRLMLSRMGKGYVRLMTGLPVADATSGFRAFRADVLRAIDAAASRSQGYAFQLELALQTWRAGYRIRELPIVFTERTQGASKMSRRIVVEAVLRTARWGLQGPRRPLATAQGATTAP